MSNDPGASDDALRAWAADPAAQEPYQDWDLLLADAADADRLALFADLADDVTLPQSRYFLRVLKTWTSRFVRRNDSDVWRSHFDRRLADLSIRTPDVKRWRHGTRLALQGVEPWRDDDDETRLTRPPTKTDRP